MGNAQGPAAQSRSSPTPPDASIFMKGEATIVTDNDIGITYNGENAKLNVVPAKTVVLVPRILFYFIILYFVASLIGIGAFVYRGHSANPLARV